MPNYVRKHPENGGDCGTSAVNVAQGEKYFDFNLLIPMPAELMMEKALRRSGVSCIT